MTDSFALITGASSGMGYCYAQQLAARGYQLLIVSNEPAIHEKAAVLRNEYPVQVVSLERDLSLPSAAQELHQYCIDNQLEVEVLVNNAGVLEEGLKPIDRATDEDVNRIIDINTKGTMYCMRAATVEMSKNGSGSIVNVASVAGVMGCGGAAYVSSKAAIIGVTKHTALRFAGTGIRCNAVCPGTIVTPMVAGMNPANMDADMFGQMAKHSDLKVPPCMPEDVANILLFLASDESRAITGQVLVTDFGGTL